jgi:hypothetical protein
MPQVRRLRPSNQGGRSGLRSIWDAGPRPSILGRASLREAGWDNECGQGGRDGAAGVPQSHLVKPSSLSPLDKCRRGGQPRLQCATVPGRCTSAWQEGWRSTWLWTDHSYTDIIKRVQGDRSKKKRDERGVREGFEGARKEQGEDSDIPPGFEPGRRNRPLQCRLDGTVGDGSGGPPPGPQLLRLHIWSEVGREVRIVWLPQSLRRPIPAQAFAR